MVGRIALCRVECTAVLLLYARADFRFFGVTFLTSKLDLTPPADTFCEVLIRWILDEDRTVSTVHRTV